MTDSPPPETSKSLIAALDRWEIELPQDQVAGLDRFVQLLWDWNTKLNLTRHTDYDKFVVRDLVDSMKLADLLAREEKVLDIGSGGGVPGIVLAVIRPDLQVSLCDSVGKKVQVLQTMVDQLDLPILVYSQRGEQVLEDDRFDACTARAVGSLSKLCRWLEGHWLAAGRLLAVKGPNWVRERQEARHLGLLRGVELRCVAEYLTPGIESKNAILQLWPKKQV